MPPPAKKIRLTAGDAPPPGILLYTDTADQNSGEVGDMVVQTYGYPAEGLNVTPDTNEADLRGLQDRFIARRRVAHYQHAVEGLQFINRLADGRYYLITLLTPPDLVAEQNEDGTWYRRPRVIEQDGPASYDMAWYRAYLRLNHLPAWFLRPEHTACLDFDTEAELLGINLAECDAPLLAKTDYLEIRYPETPSYPRVLKSGETYAISATDDDLRRLARRFPAVMENRRLHRQQGLRIFVGPTGHITVRLPHSANASQTSHPEQLVSSDRVRWVQETGEKVRASYRLRTYTPPSSDCLVPTDRTPLSQAAEDNGGYPYLNQMPNGLGIFEWLDPDHDEAAAARLGFRTPQEVLEARQEGVMDDMRERDIPRVVFYPFADFFQPEEQPEGEGRWEFFTTHGDSNARELARINFGNGAFLPDTPKPTAEDVWGVRQQIRAMVARGEVEEDLTANVELVWIPAEAPTAAVEAPVTDAAVSNQDNGYGVDPTSCLVHDALNRGENDQRGTVGICQYGTERHKKNGVVYTLDRSSPRVGFPEPHKLWAVDNKNRPGWTKYMAQTTFDWNDQRLITKLNNWRATNFNRAGFGSITDNGRPHYTREQRDWVFEYVKAAKGGNPSAANITIPELARRFNAKFTGQNRTPSAMQGLWGRLRNAYKKNSGERGGQRGDTGQPEHEVNDADGDADGEGDDINNDDGATGEEGRDREEGADDGDDVFDDVQ